MPSYFGARRSLLSVPPYSGPLAFNVATQSPSQGLNAFLTFSNNNRTAADYGPNGWPHQVKTYYPKYSGKWFVEFYIDVVFTTWIGIGTANYDTAANNGNNLLGSTTDGISYYSDGISSAGGYYNGSTFVNLPVYVAGDRISIAYDFTNGVNVVPSWYRNGSYVYSPGGQWSISQGAVPIWCDNRSGATGTISATPVYPISGFTYLGPV